MKENKIRRLSKILFRIKSLFFVVKTHKTQHHNDDDDDDYKSSVYIHSGSMTNWLAGCNIYQMRRLMEMRREWEWEAECGLYEKDFCYEKDTLSIHTL